MTFRFTHSKWRSNYDRRGCVNSEEHSPNNSTYLRYEFGKDLSPVLCHKVDSVQWNAKSFTGFARIQKILLNTTIPVAKFLWFVPVLHEKSEDIVPAQDKYAQDHNRQQSQHFSL